MPPRPKEVLTIPDVTALSLQARLAIALCLFAGYCQRRGLVHPEVTAYLDYLWRFIGLSDSPGEFDQWEADRPDLVEVGLGYEYPLGFEALLEAVKVPEREFRKAVCWTTEVLYSSMYAATDELGSRRYVGRLAELAASFGVEFPSIQPFEKSRWSDRHGWGARLSSEELAAWRAARIG